MLFISDGNIPTVRRTSHNKGSKKQHGQLKTIKCFLPLQTLMGICINYGEINVELDVMNNTETHFHNKKQLLMTVCVQPVCPQSSAVINGNIKWFRAQRV